VFVSMLDWGRRLRGIVLMKRLAVAENVDNWERSVGHFVVFRLEM